MAVKLTTSFGNQIERNCTMAITLDKRTNKKDRVKFPLSLRFNINRQRYYHHLGGNFSEVEFSEICNIRQSKSEKYTEKKKWLSTLEQYSNLLRGIGNGRPLSLEMIKSAITGVTDEPDESFISVWQQTIDDLKAHDRFTTGESYECALKSFKKILGENKVVGFQIDKALLEEWNEGMKNGVKTPDGQIVGKIGDTTRGIYLRSCRVIWNECVRRGLLANAEYPFSNRRDNDLVVIPKGNTRKAEFLDVDKMTELYKVFKEKRYPAKWPKDFTANVNFSLELFLVQYLCNGFNLADEGELTYDDYYFATNGRAFRFNRQKTAGRSENGAEVIIPIIEPLKNILDEIAAEPKKGKRVFPEILKEAVTDEEKRQRTRMENQNVRKRLQILCKEVLGWEEAVSGTWARHSFATNLRNAGVEMQYISECMGHSTQKSVTALYLASFPLDKQFEYNNKLLNLGDSSQEGSVKKEDIQNMSKEEMQALLMKLLK